MRVFVLVPLLWLALAFTGAWLDARRAERRDLDSLTHRQRVLAALRRIR